MPTNLASRPRCEAGWSVNATDQSGYMSYDPYTSTVSAGYRSATFQILIDNVSADDNHILMLDVYDATSGGVISSRAVHRYDFDSSFNFQYFVVPFYAQTGHTLEFRTFFSGGAYVRQDAVTVN